MELDRRGFIAGPAAAAVIGGIAVDSVAVGSVAVGGVAAAQVPRGPLYGMIGRMVARPGQRGALIAILLDGVSNMPGCLSYIVAEDAENADAIWISEAWDSQESHAAALALPAVKAAIAKARPLIAAMDNNHVTRPVGGHGLK